MVEEGQQAPDFMLESDEGEQVSLSQFRGKPVVLYFYPRDSRATIYSIGRGRPDRCTNG